MLITVDPATSPLNPVERNIAERYLRIKQDSSWQVDNLLMHEPRRVMPIFRTPEEVVNYYFTEKGNPYTGDPLYGVLDYYLHPERLAHALEAGPEAIKGRHIDCDDVAGFYHRAIALMPGYTSAVVTLIDHRVIGSHVVCPWEGGGRVGACDTNGFAILPDLSEKTLCDHFTEVYRKRGYQYLGAVEGFYPW